MDKDSFDKTLDANWTIDSETGIRYLMDNKTGKILAKWSKNSDERQTAYRLGFDKGYSEAQAKYQRYTEHLELQLRSLINKYKPKDYVEYDSSLDADNDFNVGC